MSTLQQILALIQSQHHVDASAFTLETGLADAGLDSLAVAELLGAEIVLKWPNDLCVRQAGGGYAKLGGILLETAALPD